MARVKKSTAGGLDGWAWNEIKALPLPWFSGLAFSFGAVESTGTWPQGLLDAYIAMIPKADGDSTPLGQTAPQCAPGCVQAVASLRLGHLRESVEGGCLSLSTASVMVYPRLRPVFSTALDIEEVLSGTGDQLYVRMADVIKSFDTVDWSIWTVLWVVLVCLAVS